MFLWNILLAFTWAAVTGHFTLSNVSGGYDPGLRGVFSSRNRSWARSRYFRRIHHALALCGFLYVGTYPRQPPGRLRCDDADAPYRPGVLAIPLDAKTDVEITMLANLITLTPGSVSLDVSSDRRFLVSSRDVHRRRG